MSKLDKHILFLIFEELQDDPKSLFSCLMVNRLWCETVIPILWRNPWSYNDINYDNKSYLFTIIASYLSDDIKEFLTRRGIQLPLVSCQTLLFDYLSFCSSINVNTINTITSIGSSLIYNQFLLQQEFYRLFMKKFPELKYLDMKSIRHQIFHYPEATLRFESLCELKCDTSVDSSYFYGLAQLCQYIQKLIIANVRINNYNGISELIGVQKNLKYFELRDDRSLLYSSGSDRYKEILFALEKSANNIIHLNIVFQYICRSSPKVFPKFHKIKSLIANFESFDKEQLKKCVYRDLEIFMIDYGNLGAASIIIENSGGHLKKILLEPYEIEDFEDNFNEDSLTFIRSIHKFCPSIECLSLMFPPSNEHLSELKKLLKICHNLKLLILIMVDISYEDITQEIFLENGENLLEILISSTPINIKEFRFCGDFDFPLETLEKFLETRKGCALSLVLTPESIYEGDDYVTLINKYKNNGVIKDFRYDSYTNIVNMDLKI
uniref:F-box domain-containing protein n=1 Tax=Rhizophagus irregularis (strain DAOM 181602 / DAOM 197198 / MUCL 43194) TaxID=747089 RepID=U9T6H3_RHIID